MTKRRAFNTEITGTRHGDKDHRQRPFKCWHCDGWHLTSIEADRAGEVREAIRKRAA